MTPPASPVALAVVAALVGGPLLWSRTLDPAAGSGDGVPPRAEHWVWDGTAFPRPWRVDTVDDAWPVVVGDRDPFRQPFDSRDPFNLPLSAAATYADPSEPAARYWAGVRGGLVNHRNGWSVAMVRTTLDDPVRTVVDTDAAPDDPRRTVDLHVPDDFTPPEGSGGRVDGATVLAQPDGTLVDLYRPQRQPDGGWTAQRWERHDPRGTGTLTGVRAAGVSYAAGLIRNWELGDVGAGRRDRFEHRLAISIPAAAMDPAPEPSDGWVTHDGSGEGRRPVAVWPANTRDDQSNPALEYRGDVPIGTTVAVPRDVDVEALGASLGLTEDKWAMATLRTLQTFGGVITDASDSHALYAEPTADPAGVAGVTRGWRAAIGHLLPVRDVTPLQPGGGPPPYLWRLAPTL